MTTSSGQPIERLGYAGLSLLTAAPIALHGVWRPVARALHTDGNALALTFAGLGVAALTWVAHVVGTTRGFPRWVAALVSGIASLVLAVCLGRGATGMGAALAGLLAVSLVSAVVMPWMLARLPHELDGLAKRRKGVAILMALLGFLTVVQSTRVATYMGDRSRPELSAIPNVPFIVGHSCLTAYVEADRLACAQEDNIYDAENWPDLSHSARSEAYSRRYAPFPLDAFAYPPTFLLLPHILVSHFDDFPTQRALWFGLNGLFLLFGLVVTALWVQGKERVRPLLLAPLVLITAPVLVTLQIGNVHAAVVVLSILAMMAFETNRPALGGAMLAFAIASKISPGLLVIVLLVRRRFREVLWTGGFGLVFVGLSLALFGPKPFVAFLTYQMPMLSSGKALKFLADSDSVAFNMGPFGLPFKLASLGLQVGDPWVVAKYVNQVFTLLVVILTGMAAKKSGSRSMQTILWLTILAFGALRSPYAPGYVLFPMFWLLSLWAVEVRNLRGILAVIGVWLVLAFVPPLSPMPLMFYTLVQQSVAIGFLTYMVLRKTTFIESNGSSK